MQRSEFKIVICGGGLAGLMTALALGSALGKQYEITLIDDRTAADADIGYGSVTSPTAYDFLRGLGLDEPRLFSKSATSFSFGTDYVDWPGTSQSWTQCHHQILPLLDGVPLQQHLTRNQRPLAPLLISGIAARQGKFAHPPEDPDNPLSRAEYGYQFSVTEWAHLLTEFLPASRVKRLEVQVQSVTVERGKISELVLASGETVAGDLFIDCSGPHRLLATALKVSFEGSRTISLTHTEQATDTIGLPCRSVTANAEGWVAQTHLQNSVHMLRVGHASDPSAATTLKLGGLTWAWVDNMVAIGIAASAHDPLTPGPMVMLQRDIERLLDLVPITLDFEIERREYNRRYQDDLAHTNMFADAFYISNEEQSAFWSDAKAASHSEGLSRKIVQFESRGILAKYDLEPFNDEDWTILHHGLGRRAARYDLQADASPKPMIDQQLDAMSRAIEQLVARMPPHHLYVANMKRYFEKQQYV